jgi:hypothetical protein
MVTANNICGHSSWSFSWFQSLNFPESISQFLVTPNWVKQSKCNILGNAGQVTLLFVTQWGVGLFANVSYLATVHFTLCFNCCGHGYNSILHIMGVTVDHFRYIYQVQCSTRITNLFKPQLAMILKNPPVKNEFEEYGKNRTKLHVAVFVVLDSKWTKMCSNMTDGT